MHLLDLYIHSVYTPKVSCTFWQHRSLDDGNWFLSTPFPPPPLQPPLDPAVSPSCSVCVCVCVCVHATISTCIIYHNSLVLRLYSTHMQLLRALTCVEESLGQRLHTCNIMFMYIKSSLTGSESSSIDLTCL